MERVRLSDRIAEQLEQMIAEGVLKPGERLPAERQLAERLGVSRPSLREAIQKLASKGLLCTRQGGGTYVSDTLDTQFADPLIKLLRGREDAEFDTLQVRLELEGVAASLAATRATAEDRARIRAAYERMAEVHRSDADSERKLEVDLAFHEAIIEASHNVVLVHFMRGVMAVLKSSVGAYLDLFYSKQPFVKTLCEQHKAICDAIDRRDPEAARAAARNHLEFSYDSYREFREEARFARGDKLRSSLYGSAP
ncbi:MAG: FadR/GntR family transcriptional regulator [Gammaproteobacteria bacterium]